MTRQFTASEVRANASFRRKAEPELAEMLYAYADRLEADEKAQPVTWVNPDDLHNLPTPTNDSKRLAEALSNAREYVQECFDKEKVEMAGYLHASELPAIGAMLREIDDVLAAQTQPLARTCSDERPCVNCFADQGECLGPAPETIRQRKEQRAVEIASAISTRPEFSRYESQLILDIVKAALAAQENRNG